MLKEAKDSNINCRSSPSLNVSLGQLVLVNGTLVLLQGAKFCNETSNAFTSLTPALLGALSVINVAADATSAPVNVSGAIALSGVLTVILDGTGEDGAIVPVIDIVGSGAISGSFSTIQARLRDREIGVANLMQVESNKKKCQKVSGTGATSLTTGSLGVLLRVDNSKCKKDRKAVWIAVGVVGGVLLLTAIIVTVLCLLRPKLRSTPLFWAKDRDARSVR